MSGSPAATRRSVLFIRHDPDAYPGQIGRRLSERGFAIDELQIIDSYDDPNPTVAFGDPDPYDLIVPLGCIRSVYDEASIGNWIGAELGFLTEAHRRNIPILGVCFGGQALAAALGGVVEPTPLPEVGWRQIESDKPDVVASGPWMQWHSDRFTVPPGATELARSASGPQAFVDGRSVGVQFHPEVTADIVNGWLDEAPPEELDQPGVDVERIRAETDKNADAAGRACHRLVDWFLDEVAELS